MSKLSTPCLSGQEQILEDGSKVIREHNEHTTGGEKRKREVDDDGANSSNDSIDSSKFISVNTFEAKSSKNKRKDIIKWAELPLNIVFRVNAVRELTVNRDGKKSISRIGELENEDGTISVNVWLTSIIEKELKDITDFETKHVYIRSCGMKENKSGTRKYYDFDIVKE